MRKDCCKAAVISLLCIIIPSASAQDATAVRTEIIAQGLDHPWALAFIDRKRMLVSERAGTLRVVQAGVPISAPVAGLPKIYVGGQGGLLDVITDRQFSSNRIIYFCYSKAANAKTGGNGNSTALASARLSDDATQLEQVKVLFNQQPKFDSRAHFGCRIVENTDGTLFLTLGDRFSRMQDAQTLNNHHGKIVRIRKDGSVPTDNPFVGKPGALAEIWSIGHRNVQGATLGPDGKLWTHEHGPQGGDEINRPQAGKNYGWPVITYGENYGGGKIGAGLTAKAGMEQPLHQWTPSIAPSGMRFLRSDRYGKAWQGNLFVGSLKFHYLARLELKDSKVVHEERLLQNVGQRIREGPDGLLYVLTDEANGQLLRVLPAKY
ncbi:PQQ-dependent sugar dehydrogenase [Herminiimonas sp. NPDC097707]|uniref:PQQ-dependent sugar dehydrogenase n=1 Tax=Herminiimonas sp. NPDC097707 TaxID=3364007 RepID=UPI00383B71B0